MTLPLRSAVPRRNAFLLPRRCRASMTNSRTPLLFRPLSSSYSSSSSSPLPIVQTCPEPTCACAPTPLMPDGLAIDRENPLNATMAAYAQQVLISTGRPDWSSRIEDDGVGESWGALARGLKGLIGRGGKYADPYNNVVITNSSFAPSADPSSDFASAFIFPAFKYVPFIPISSSTSSSAPAPAPAADSEADLETFVRAMLLPHELHPAHSAVSEPRRREMTRAPELVAHFPDMIDIKQSPTILICSHGGRDMRCGIMGPVLRAEFQRVLEQRGFSTNDQNEDGTRKVDGHGHANLGLISHIGGHKFAGNVIIYIPPGLTTSSSSTISTSPSPLAGKGIWYGRVEPKHVEGIIDETILRGRVVADHFRGGIGMEGEIYRL